MKKLLITTAAVIAFASAAAAEVVISGNGYMGAVYDQGINNSDVVFDSGSGTFVRTSDAGVRFQSRVRLNFALTQETDSGLTFGASVRADQATDANNGQAGSVFMSGAFGTISMGDVNGAAESAVGNLSGVGYTGLGDLNEAFYLQQGNSDLDDNDVRVSEFALPAALYEYTNGNTSVYLSLGNPGGIALDDTSFDTVGVDVEDTVIDQAYGLGAKYAVDNYSVGIGYESIDISGIATDTVTLDQSEFNETVDSWILGGSATYGAVTLKGQYGQGSGDAIKLTQYGVSGDYTLNDLTVTAFWRNVELETAGDTASAKSQPYGIGATYDLGGGASVQGGIVNPDRFGEDYRADLGVNFTF
jgi:outer membrane protein OmpU